MDHDNGRTAVVLAGGGERVIAWQAGVLAGLADAGIDARTAGTIVGTSAGSYVAARLAAGEDPRDAADGYAALAPRPVDASRELPFDALADAFETAGTVLEGRRRIGAYALAARTRSQEESIARLAGRLPDVPWPAALHVTGIDAERGERVTVDRRSGVSLATGVAASRAVPGALPPIEIGGRPLIDGAVGSATNADVVVERDADIARAILVVAIPTESPTLARLWEDALRAELWQLDAAGIETYLVRANDDDMRAMGPDFMDSGRAPLAVRSGRRAGQAVGPALSDALRPRRPLPGSQRRLRARLAVRPLLGAAAFVPSAQPSADVG